LRAKAAVAKRQGVEVEIGAVHPLLKPHQAAIVRWAVSGGRRAIFAAFGLGKTFMQIEAVRLVIEPIGGRALIVAPLGVRQEFIRDGHKLGQTIRFIRRIEEAAEPGIYITNYETVRDGKLDPRLFDATSLDEASCLRGFGGTKTFREFMAMFAGDDRKAGVRTEGIRYRFVATATPSPNEFIELLAYAAYLGVMDVSEAKTRFFKRDSTKADKLTLHAHKEAEFWMWVSSWAVFLQKPSDLGFDDEGYDLPPVTVRWHELPADMTTTEQERDGQGILIREASASVIGAAREKRDSLSVRVAKTAEIAAASPADSFIFWHDLEAEREALEDAIPGLVTVYGSQDVDERETLIADFSDGRIKRFGGKPVMLGSGCNFQRHCHRAVFVGITAKFNDFIQAWHRLVRFLQQHEVEVDIIYTEAERGTRTILEEKWRNHEYEMAKMSEIIRNYGLNEEAIAKALERSIGVERIEVKGENYTLVNNDTVIETSRMAEASVDLIVTSIPFSTQYEYTPSYNDFGHTDDDAHFWAQMDFLTPQLLRVLSPGRWAAIHVKDRIVPGGINGLGFQTLSSFHSDCITHFKRHGFAFMGMKTIVTDVVRENNQTYRLGWTEQCKDATKMGVGVPEYLLIFRKPQGDTTRSYADKPVRKDKKEWTGDGWKNEEGYSRARWQIDAHAFARSSGNRFLTAQEIQGLPADQVYRIWRSYNATQLYDFEHHVAIAEALEMKGALPPTFMLLPPHSWHDDVWADVARMLTMNTIQAQQGKEMHLCPLQFDIVDRVIAQASEPGETVFDPFGGLMTVPYRAIKLGRRGVGVELNPGYFLDGVKHCEAMAREVAIPSLFDYAGISAESEAA
jgi:hypothetical protein